MAHKAHHCVRRANFASPATPTCHWRTGTSPAVSGDFHELPPPASQRPTPVFTDAGTYHVSIVIGTNKPPMSQSTSTAFPQAKSPTRLSPQAPVKVPRVKGLESYSIRIHNYAKAIVGSGCASTSRAVGSANIFSGNLVCTCNSNLITGAGCLKTGP